MGKDIDTQKQFKEQVIAMIKDIIKDNKLQPTARNIYIFALGLATAKQMIKQTGDLEYLAMVESIIVEYAQDKMQETKNALQDINF